MYLESRSAPPKEQAWSRETYSLARYCPSKAAVLEVTCGWDTGATSQDFVGVHHLDFCPEFTPWVAINLARIGDQNDPEAYLAIRGSLPVGSEMMARKSSQISVYRLKVPFLSGEFHSRT